VRAKDLREKFNLLYEAQERIDMPVEDRCAMLRSVVGDIIIWIEEQERRPAEYVPEPRLGPRPESIKVNHAAVDRIVDAARKAFEKGE